MNSSSVDAVSTSSTANANATSTTTAQESTSSSSSSATLTTTTTLSQRIPPNNALSSGGRGGMTSSRGGRGYGGGGAFGQQNSYSSGGGGYGGHRNSNSGNSGGGSAGHQGMYDGAFAPAFSRGATAYQVQQPGGPPAGAAAALFDPWASYHPHQPHQQQHYAYAPFYAATTEQLSLMAKPAGALAMYEAPQPPHPHHHAHAGPNPVHIQQALPPQHQHHQHHHMADVKRVDTRQMSAVPQQHHISAVPDSSAQNQPPTLQQQQQPHASSTVTMPQDAPPTAAPSGHTTFGGLATPPNFCANNQPSAPGLPATGNLPGVSLLTPDMTWSRCDMPAFMWFELFIRAGAVLSASAVGAAGGVPPASGGEGGFYGWPGNVGVVAPSSLWSALKDAIEKQTPFASPNVVQTTPLPPSTIPATTAAPVAASTTAATKTPASATQQVPAPAAAAASPPKSVVESATAAASTSAAAPSTARDQVPDRIGSGSNALPSRAQQHSQQPQSHQPQQSQQQKPQGGRASSNARHHVNGGHVNAGSPSVHPNVTGNNHNNARQSSAAGISEQKGDIEGAWRVPLTSKISQQPTSGETAAATNTKATVNAVTPAPGAAAKDVRTSTATAAAGSSGTLAARDALDAPIKGLSFLPVEFLNEMKDTFGDTIAYHGSSKAKSENVQIAFKDESLPDSQKKKLLKTFKIIAEKHKVKSTGVIPWAEALRSAQNRKKPSNGERGGSERGERGGSWKHRDHHHQQPPTSAPAGIKEEGHGGKSANGAANGDTSTVKTEVAVGITA